MAQIPIPRHLDLQVVQGGADAFVQGSVATGIIPADGNILKVTFVEVKFAAGAFYTIASDFFIGWSMSRDTKGTLVSYDDQDCLMADGFDHLLTTSGATIIPTAYTFAPPSGIYIVDPTIYFQLDSTGTGAASTANVRIHYEEVKATEVEILRLLNNA